MQKNDFLEVGESVEGFEIIDSEMPIEELTPPILWNLWDIGVKFGILFEKGIRFKASSLYMELYDFRGNGRGGSAGMCVFKSRPSQLTDEGTFFLTLQNDMLVTWDRGFTAAEIRSIIGEIDDYARSEEMMIDGKRLFLFEQEPLRPAKMSVRVFLENRDAITPVLPGMDVNQVLESFDQPELLSVIDLGPMKLICLKSEKDRLFEKYQGKLRKMTEMGISGDDIAKMHIEELMALKAKL